MAPASFAAAAQNAGSTATRDEWSRRPNGATQTFRRSSASTSMSSINPQQEPSSVQAPPRYVPPHRNGTVADTRYSKDQLLDLFKVQQTSEGGLRDGLPSLYMGGWQPDISNGTGSAGWGRTENSRDAQPGPDICWDRDGTVEPLGLTDMDDEERELFTTSVNTPLKPPSNVNKENQASNGMPGRKVSLSGQTYSPGAFGPLSPTASRAPGRRRDTSESYPFPTANPLASPTGGFNRDDQRAPSPPPSLTRRRTDLKDLNKVSEKDGDGDEKSASSPFGSLRRNPTGPLNSGFGAPSSPWSNAPQSAGLSPMGSFGNFGLSQQASSGDKRPGMGSGRAESRFKNLLNKDSSEDSASRTVERKASVTSLSRVNENESWRPQPAQEPTTAPVDEVEEDLSSGNGPGADIQSQQQYQTGSGRGFGTPSRTQSRDDFGFGAFGMTSDNAQGLGQGFLQGQHAYQQTPAQQPRQLGGNEPMSPTDTNPYKSPEQHGIDRLTGDMEGEHDDMQAQLPGLGAFGGDQQHHQFGGMGGFGGLPNLGRAGGPHGTASDRSQTSSATGNRGFPSLGGLGQMGGHPGAGGWPASQGGFGTTGRPTAGLGNAFGSGIFSTSMAEMQSPGLAGLGSPGMFGPQSAGGLGGRGGLFSPGSQEQMRQAEQQRDLSGDRSGQTQFTGQGEAFGGQHDQDMQADKLGQFGAPGQHQAIGQSAQQAPGQGQQQAGANQPPAPQQRTMVMPDRMRWIYKDPSGNMQGPWTGLEMHDWYKAGFFSPELLVKKMEDPEYEPLAQLIRRIGNSREPFLVPQIGIPYGQNAAASATPTTWTGTGTPSTTSTGPTSTAAQPPFASSFPSFGTTLTAEQQNALERRKQEEQYLMARQKEHLAQQQIAQRMQHQQHGGMQQHGGLMPGGSQLHHHSSAQSLHSQPSFGSMTSPPSGPFQPSPTQTAQGQVPGSFEQSYRGGNQQGLGAVGAGIDTLGHIREEEIPGIMDRLNLGNQPQGQFGAPGQPLSGQQMQSPSAQEQHERQVQQVLQDRARLQQEQAAHDATQPQSEEPPSQNERLQQFQQLQGQATSTGLDPRFQAAIGKSPNVPSEEPSSTAESSIGSPQQPEQHEMSLKEKIQQTQSNQQSPAPQQPGFPHPFPPAPSQSPLPAPAAQRTGRTSVADQLQTEQRDLSQTPSVDTPSAAVAPWAKEPAEAQKGPSLKEIQAMEAKKAAEQEELAAANRRAAFQREMEAQAQAATIAPAPGLPASASWGAAAGSPATPTGTTSSAWAKATQKPSAPATAKSMAQIQKEEEARKRRQAAALAQAQAQAHQSTAMSNVSAPAGGKSYANLAGKVSAPAPVSSPNAPASAWTTVGAGGKPKTPAAPPAAPTPTRSTSTNMASAQAAAAAKKAPPARTTTGGVNAQEEFKKWAIGELRPDLNKGYSADDVVATLTQLPAETELLTEVVHGASSTIDSRHFAEEFLRRKRLADKGLVDTSAPPKSASPAGAAGKADAGGGWSEVAKKGGSGAGAKDGVAANGATGAAGVAQGDGAFRVVPAKKRGGRK